VFETVEEFLYFSVGECAGFSLGMQVCVPEDILQAAIPQARDALFGRQRGF
jgi:hypothetical protein